MTSYRDVVKVVLPAVVSIRAEPKTPVAKKDRQAPRRRPAIEGIPGLPEEFKKFFPNMEEFDGQDAEDFLPRQSFGSGLIIDPKGVVLTNYHVVAGAGKVRVTLKDGTDFTSTDIKGDRKNDLAIIRIDAKTPLPYLQFGDSDAMEIGDRVLAVGAPFGLTGSVTSGIVSAKGRSGLNNERTVYEDYLQTDAAINPGNSGGPLVNLEGQVIGINTAIKSGNGGFQGVGLAITSNLAKNIVNQLLRDGVVHRGYLGVAVGPVDPEVAARFGIKEHEGVEVSRVSEDGPAAKAGIREHDIITSVAGKTVKDGRELQHIVGSLSINKPVDIGVVRDGESKVVHVTIAEQPDNYGIRTVRTSGSPRSSDQDAEEVTLDNFGMGISELTPELAKQYGYSDDAKGVIITSVEPGSVAAEKGMIRGALITKVERKAVTSTASAKELLAKADPNRGVLVQLEYPPRLGGGGASKVLKPAMANK
jgi:serine protease Do